MALGARDQVWPGLQDTLAPADPGTDYVVVRPHLAHLADLHTFLISFPASYWKTQEDDTPMRTIKTVIHTIVKSLGESVLESVAGISDSQDSELVPYIRKLLNSGVGAEAGPAAAATRPVSAEKKRMPRYFAVTAAISEL